MIEGTRPTVLVIDDEPVIRSLAGVYLRAAGFRVLEAASHAEAECHAGPIDLLLCDVYLRGESGLVVAQAMTARHAGLRVLYMSGTPSMAHAMLSQGYAFLAKPFEFSDLVDKVRELLAGP